MQRILAILLFFISVQSHAQLNTTPDWEASIFTGPLLPSSISGLSESIMMTGFKLGKGMSYYRPEVSYAQGNEAGTSYRMVVLTFKNPVHIEGLEDIRPFFLTGLQMSEYEPVFNGSTGARERGNGFHLGFGIEVDLGKEFQIRNDYLFANGPGRVLVVHLGLQLRFGGESSEGQN